jgi:Uma2 family endonuclease
LQGAAYKMIDDMYNMQKIRKPHKKKYTFEEFLDFVKDKNERYELIDGEIYMMASPTVDHQRIIGFIYRKIANYLDGKSCEPFVASLDVVLFKKEKKDKDNEKIQNVFQPDVFVVCDREKIAKERIYGAPDLVFEIVSAGTAGQDYISKLNTYMKYGVKEYWIVNPETKQIFVNINGEKINTHTYAFDDKIKIGIFDDFYIDFSELCLV